MSSNSSARAARSPATRYFGFESAFGTFRVVWSETEAGPKVIYIHLPGEAGEVRPIKRNAKRVIVIREDPDWAPEGGNSEAERG